MDDISSCLARRWIHAGEEDAGATRTYRPQGWPLPLSRRPRQILELHDDGRFISRTAGPADARIGREGRWTLSEPATLTLCWDDGDEQASVEILECREDLLKVQTLSGSID